MPENIEVKIGKLETKLDFVIVEIKDIKDNFANRLDRVEQDVDWIKSRVWLGIGIVAVVEPIVMAVIIKYITK